MNQDLDPSQREPDPGATGGAEPAPAGFPGQNSGDAPPPRDDWLDRNRAPILVIALAAALTLGSVFFIPTVSSVRAAPLPEIDLKAVAEKAGPGAILADAIVGSVILGGALACLAAGIAWLAVPEARRWLDNFLGRAAVRPLSALRLLDVAAAVALYISARDTLVIAALRLSLITPENAMAASLILGFAAISSGVAAGVMLARHRAGGKHGSNGIWPFWPLAPRNPPRSIFWDIAAGVCSYPLLIWFVGLASVLNKLLVRQLGLQQDTHRLVGEMLRPMSTEVLVTIFVLATAGAAISEEILFRGMLYNALRRYLGPGACAGLPCAHTCPP